jgi:hypothetical protein
MELSAKKIIKYFREKYPISNSEINNGCDLDIDESVSMTNQFIIGLAHSDHMSSDIRQYEYNMQQWLQNYGLVGKCLPWSFEDYDIAELPQILKDLGEYFRITLDVERMIGKLNIRQGNGKRYFIVITVISFGLLFSKLTK